MSIEVQTELAVLRQAQLTLASRCPTDVPAYWAAASALPHLEAYNYLTVPSPAAVVLCAPTLTSVPQRALRQMPSALLVWQSSDADTPRTVGPRYRTLLSVQLVALASAAALGSRVPDEDMIIGVSALLDALQQTLSTSLLADARATSPSATSYGLGLDIEPPRFGQSSAVAPAQSIWPTLTDPSIYVAAVEMIIPADKARPFTP